VKKIKTHLERYTALINFLKAHVSKESKILDLGIENDLSRSIRKEGYKIDNTKGEDLDLDTSAVRSKDYEVVTSFEIFEHMLCPFHLLRDISADKLVVSVPKTLVY
jgi:hypothetical protein